MIENFGVSADPAHWGVVGWSSGGTCALNLTVKYPDLFSAFVNIDGDLAPNAGTKMQTIDRLYGGNAEAWNDWDPATVMARHGDYDAVAGWFAVSEPPGSVGPALSGADLQGLPEETNPAGNPSSAARTLCRIGSEYGIDCAVVPQSGKHDWPFAAQAFRNSLPWLAAQIGTPDVPEVALPGTSSQPEGVTIAAEAAAEGTPAPRPTGVR
jgi:S-formylglutathione hydrolase FrmB